MDERQLKGRLRFRTETIDDIANPVGRIIFVEEIRSAVADLLTDALERACWDARVADLDDVAVTVPGMTHKAFTDYARRFNGRLNGRERIRWNDPFHPHRRQVLADQIGRASCRESVGQYG